MFRVSYSKIRKWRQCHKLHDYSANQKLRRRRKGRPLLAGSIGHEMLDADAQDKDAYEVLEKYAKEYEELFSEEQEMYGDLIGDMKRIYKAYHRRYEDDGLYYIESEVTLIVQLDDDTEFICIIDKIVEDEDERLWLMDHKFNKNIPTPDARASDLQLLGNAWAWDQANPDRPLTGIIWDYCRSKPPTIPEQLKAGGLTRRKNLRSDVYTYRERLKELGLNEADYSEVLEALVKNDALYFARTVLPVGDALQESILGDYRSTATEIRVLGETLKDRNLTRDCKQCDYYNLCQAELRGLDADYIRKTEYYTRKDNAKTEEQEDEEQKN